MNSSDGVHHLSKGCRYRGSNGPCPQGLLNTWELRWTRPRKGRMSWTKGTIQVEKRLRKRILESVEKELSYRVQNWEGAGPFRQIKRGRIRAKVGQTNKNEGKIRSGLKIRKSLLHRPKD